MIMIQNKKWYKEIRISILYALKYNDRYGNNVQLEGMILGLLVLLGVSKGCSVKDVLEQWKVYCFSIFNAPDYILSELPPNYIIPAIDQDNSDITLAKKEMYAWLAMRYTDYRTSYYLLPQNETILNTEELMYLEEIFLKIIHFEYYEYFRNIPNFYGYFCQYFLGAMIGTNRLNTSPMFDNYYELFAKKPRGPQEFFVCSYGIDDPRNIKYVNSIMEYGKKHRTLDNFEPPFYWSTNYINNNDSVKIKTQILTGLIKLTNSIAPEMEIELSHDTWKVNK